MAAASISSVSPAQFSHPSSSSGALPKKKPMLTVVRTPDSVRASAQSDHDEKPKEGNERLKEKKTEAVERKKDVSRKIASHKAISVILRREATKAIVDKKNGSINSKKLLPRTVLEALHDRVSALRWESALKAKAKYAGYFSLWDERPLPQASPRRRHDKNGLSGQGVSVNPRGWSHGRDGAGGSRGGHERAPKVAAGGRREQPNPADRGRVAVFDLLREQLWYTPNTGIYIKLIVMLGKCKQSERAHALFQSMAEEGCIINHESYTALVSAYGRSGLFNEAFSLLEYMKNTDGCHPDVQTYSVLIKSCLHYYKFDKVQFLLSDMKNLEIKPNTVTYNTLIDAYGKAERFAEMESSLMEMLGNRECKPDIWTMNATLRAFGGSGQIEMMEKCYDKFQGSGISPDIKTFNILLDSYSKARRYEKMSAVMEYMHKYHFSWTLVTYNIVIDAFGRAGDLKQMEHIFRLMKSERVKPNRVTLCSLVRAYGRAEAVDRIKAVLWYVENLDIMLDTVVFNCLVDAYGRAGRLPEMREVPELMKRRGCSPDKITYSTMIKAYLSRGINDQRVQDLQDRSGEGEGRLSRKKHISQQSEG
ncbi:Pentatricopeptide repeat-containing protein [Platanthera guangdongensis]|uniref:Pentatricopeptide repeat-containing protein n=1 Tax=Platanthera guangdongensis TaxID=2320717 RepID=A0ABR2M7K9_9ASPA